MALQKQVVPLTFGQGIDTKSDEKTIPLGKLRELENGVFTKTNRISKRPGQRNLSRNILGGGTLTNGQGLINFENELVQINNNVAYTYNESSDNWVSKGETQALTASFDQVIKNFHEQTQPDATCNLNVCVYAWTDSRGGVRSQVQDLVSGSVLIPDFSLNSGAASHPKCISFGNFSFVFYVVAGTIRVRRISSINPSSFSSETTLLTDLNVANPRFDLTVWQQYAVIAYHTTGGALKIAYVKQNMTVAGVLDNLFNPVTFTEAPEDCITIVNDSNIHFFVGWANATDGVRALAVNLDFSTFVPATEIEASGPTFKNITGIRVGADDFRFFYEIEGTSNQYASIRSRSITDAGVVSSDFIDLLHVGLHSKAFVYDGDVYLVATHDTDEQACYFLMRPITGKSVSRSLYGIGGGLSVGPGLTEVNQAPEGTFIVPTMFKATLESVDATLYSRRGVGVVTYDFVRTSGIYDSLSRQIGKNSHMVGGIMQMYDGQSLVELGFNLYPENIEATDSASGGSMSDGTYLYYVTYEWYDNKGQLHRSAPSTPLSVVVNGGGSSQSVDLTIPSLFHTDKKPASVMFPNYSRTNVTIGVYRTENAGSIAYKVSSNSNPTFNDNTETISFTDTLADADIIDNEILYTTGGVLENFPPPPCSAVSTYRNRLVVINDENKNELWFSKSQVTGEGIAFHPLFKILVDPAGGDCTTVQALDDKLIIFKNDSIQVTAGDGPNDLGQQNDFYAPQLIPTDVGCPFPESIVQTPDGIMFKSNKGIYLLDRSLQTQYIGKDVEDFNGLTITSANIVKDQNLVIFTPIDGLAPVYDFFQRQWGTFDNFQSQDAVIWQSQYVRLQDDGTVSVSEADSFLDNMVPYKLRLTSGWISLAGLQGFQRIYSLVLLGTFKSDHQLKVSVGYNFEPTYQQVNYFDATTIVGPTFYGDQVYYGAEGYGDDKESVMQCRVMIDRQKCQAIRFKIEDVTNNINSGESYSITGAAIVAGVKAGTFRPNINKQIGSV